MSNKETAIQIFEEKKVRSVGMPNRKNGTSPLWMWWRC
jgi:hypothetical protein